jgi:hypothetical protein
MMTQKPPFIRYAWTLAKFLPHGRRTRNNSGDWVENTPETEAQLKGFVDLMNQRITKSPELSGVSSCRVEGLDDDGSVRVIYKGRDESRRRPMADWARRMLAGLGLGE